MSSHDVDRLQQISRSDIPSDDLEDQKDMNEPLILPGDGVAAQDAAKKKKMMMAGAGVFFLVLIIGVSVGATSGGHKTQNAGPGGSPTPAPGPPGVPTLSPTAMPTLTPRARCSGNSSCSALNQHCGKDEFCPCNEGFFNWDYEHSGYL